VEYPRGLNSGEGYLLHGDTLAGKLVSVKGERHTRGKFIETAMYY
jgi:hypothetical protein